MLGVFALVNLLPCTRVDRVRALFELGVRRDCQEL